MTMDYNKPKAPKYADSTISEKAFKRAIIWFTLYTLLFCLGVYVAVAADMAR